MTSLFSNSQSIQTHYDFGKDRNHLTTTVEFFKSDPWGSTFFFVDFTHNSQGTEDIDKNHISSSYMEISRDLKFWDGPFAAHLEYNGGLGSWGYIPDAYLVGGTYSLNAKDFSKGIVFQALYKSIRNELNKDKFRWQFTTVWYYNYSLGGDMSLSFNGYFDFWSEKIDWSLRGENKKTDLILFTEPQLWFNYNKHFSIGGELEITNNYFQKGLQLNQTLGVKWIF